MARTTAQILGAYRRQLTEQGITAPLLDDLVRDAAHRQAHAVPLVVVAETAEQQADVVDLARIGHLAYGLAVSGGITFVGSTPVPGWDDLTNAERHGWTKAAQAIAGALQPSATVRTAEDQTPDTSEPESDQQAVMRIRREVRDLPPTEDGWRVAEPGPTHITLDIRTNAERPLALARTIGECLTRHVGSE